MSRNGPGGKSVAAHDHAADHLDLEVGKDKFHKLRKGRVSRLKLVSYTILFWACLLPIVRVGGFVDDKQTCKFTAMLIAFVLAVVGVRAEHAPALFVRIFWAAAILVVTVVMLCLPWLSRGSSAMVICNQHLAHDEEIWTRRHFLTDVVTMAAIAPIAMACAVAWHPPSHYARGAVVCTLIIWLMKCSWVMFNFIQWCGNPCEDIVETSLLIQILFGSGMGLLVVALFLVNALLVLRIEALENTLGYRVSWPIQWVVGSYCLLILVNDAFFSGQTVEWMDASRLLPEGLGLTAGHANWIDLVLPFFPLALAFLAVSSFSKPLELLQAEAARVRGAPRAQALWAVWRLRIEMAGALLMTLMGCVKLVFQLYSWGLGEQGGAILGIISSFEDLMHALGTALLCGFLWRGGKLPSPPHPGAPSVALAEVQHTDSRWSQKVRELADRGFTLASLLDFYELLLKGELMPSFLPERSTTRDVVRQAIIPSSRSSRGQDMGGRALASVWNNGEPVLPARMVTHSWSNIFMHLVASIIADALEHDTYAEVANAFLLSLNGVKRAREQLQERSALSLTYWVCAFSVNQHASICAGFGPAPAECTAEWHEWNSQKRDSVTGAEIPLCDCREPKFFNDEPVECEMNKFDHMMAYLCMRVEGFKQVVAIDENFDLFSRAWCLAELAEAEARKMPQSVKIQSEASLDRHYDSLSLLDVRTCRAARAKDKDFILGRIGNVEAFNARLQWLVFGAHGLFESLATSQDAAAIIGRFARRASFHR